MVTGYRGNAARESTTDHYSQTGSQKPRERRYQLNQPKEALQRQERNNGVRQMTQDRSSTSSKPSTNLPISSDEYSYRPPRMLQNAGRNSSRPIAPINHSVEASQKALMSSHLKGLPRTVNETRQPSKLLKRKAPSAGFTAYPTPVNSLSMTQTSLFQSKASNEELARLKEEIEELKIELISRNVEEQYAGSQRKLVSELTQTVETQTSQLNKVQQQLQEYRVKESKSAERQKRHPEPSQALLPHVKPTSEALFKQFVHHSRLLEVEQTAVENRIPPMTLVVFDQSLFLHHPTWLAEREKIDYRSCLKAGYETCNIITGLFNRFSACIRRYQTNRAVDIVSSVESHTDRTLDTNSLAYASFTTALVEATDIFRKLNEPKVEVLDIMLRTQETCDRLVFLFHSMWKMLSQCDVRCKAGKDRSERGNPELVQLLLSIVEKLVHLLTPSSDEEASNGQKPYNGSLVKLIYLFYQLQETCVAGLGSPVKRCLAQKLETWLAISVTMFRLLSRCKTMLSQTDQSRQIMSNPGASDFLQVCFSTYAILCGIINSEETDILQELSSHIGAVVRLRRDIETHESLTSSVSRFLDCYSEALVQQTLHSLTTSRNNAQSGTANMHEALVALRYEFVISKDLYELILVCCQRVDEWLEKLDRCATTCLPMIEYSRASEARESLRSALVQLLLVHLTFLGLCQGEGENLLPSLDLARYPYPLLIDMVTVLQSMQEAEMDAGIASSKQPLRAFDATIYNIIEDLCHISRDVEHIRATPGKQ